MTMLFASTAQEYTKKNINKPEAKTSKNQIGISTEEALLGQSVFNMKNSGYELLSFGKAKMGIFADAVSDATVMDEYVGSKGESSKNVTNKDNIFSMDNEDVIEKYEELRNYLDDSNYSESIYEDDEVSESSTKREHKIIGVSRDLGTPLHNLFTETASTMYQSSVEGIQNTNYGDRIVRRKKMNQVVKETFFYGANRFGNNFIA